MHHTTPASYQALKDEGFLVAASQTCSCFQDMTLPRTLAVYDAADLILLCLTFACCQSFDSLTPYCIYFLCSKSTTTITQSHFSPCL